MSTQQNNIKILSIIPARGGSKGVPRKNIRDVAGKPLIAWTIEASLAAPSVTKTVVSTDDEEIATVARQYGAEVVMRPDEFAQDTSPTEEAITYTLEELEKQGHTFDYELLLQPTCPTRNAQHIEEAIETIISGGYDSLVGVEPVTKYRYELKEDGQLGKCWTKRARRQERDAVYLENGTIYLTKAHLAKAGDLFGETTGALIMDHYSSVNVDDFLDLIVATETVKMLQSKKKQPSCHPRPDQDPLIIWKH